MRQTAISNTTLGLCIVLLTAAGCGEGSGPDGPGSSQETSGECPGGRFSLDAEPTEGNCSSEIIRDIQENVPDENLFDGTCGKTFSPSPRLWDLWEDGEPVLRFSSYNIVSGPRRHDGFEPGSMTVEAKKYGTEWPAPNEEPVEECKQDFAVEFIPLE